ncbi:hypothetical protein [Chitinophaga costaii]|nr:hypothetical protein [Chitinophaga costaii]
MRLLPRHYLLLIIGLPAMAQTPKKGLHFTSSIQQKITVYNGTIFVNGNKAHQLDPEAINYGSKRNRLVENEGTVFLFLDIAPLQKLYVFRIDHSNADSVLSAASSDVKDLDHDGLLEFGGSDATQAYPSADSAYYVPTHYYEIARGRITPDAELTQKMDKKINGVYLANPLNPNGQCCKVIPKKH